jgi:hypothetical protein
MPCLEEDHQQDDQQDKSTNSDIHEQSPTAPLFALSTNFDEAGSSAYRRFVGKSGHLCSASAVSVGVGSPFNPWMTHMLRKTDGT